MPHDQPPSQDSDSTLYWDPQNIGHHYRYLEAVLDAAPEDRHVIVPDWYTAPPPRHVRLTPVPQSTRNEYAALCSAVETHAPASVILGVGHRLSRRIAIAPRPPQVGIVVLDLRGVPAALNPTYRESMAEYPKAIIDAGFREVSVRRTRIAYLNLNPEAIVGTDAVRDSSDTYLDPLESIDPQPSCATSNGRVRVVLPGALSGRKGIVDLARAVMLLPTSTQELVEVVLAGEPQDDGREQIQKAEQVLARTLCSSRVVPRRLSDEELATLLDTADVVVLPYRSHRGGSGLLGTAMACTTAQVVVSDFGWSGTIAKGLGAVTFENEDPEALSRALAGAIHAGPRLDPALEADIAQFYGTDRSFGDHVWRMVDKVALSTPRG